MVWSSAALSASSDGTVGVSSQGQNLIRAVIDKLIHARDFDDIVLGSYVPGSDLVGNDDLNIATNYGTIATRTYEVTLTGEGAGGAFELSGVSDPAQKLPFSPCFNDAVGTAGCTAATAGSAIAGQGGASKPLSDTSLNANVSVTVADADLASADADTYEGHVIVTVQPE
jgi:hypothetical protein